MKGKEFLKRNKKWLIAIGATVGVSVIVAIILKMKGPIMVRTTLSNGAAETAHTIESAIEFLKNVSGERTFAIFKEGAENIVQIIDL